MTFYKDPEHNPHGINAGQRVQNSHGLGGLVHDVYFSDDMNSMAASPNGPLPNVAQVSWDDGTEDYDYPLTDMAPEGLDVKPA